LLPTKLSIFVLFISFHVYADDEADIDYLLDLSLKELLQIKVSAQKREEPGQKVPASIRVITNHHLANSNITRIEELSHVATSLAFDKRVDFAKSSLKIRGIGTQVFGGGVEPSVATIIDGVVMARGGVGFDDLVDIERIEIMNGPQSTLFGKNASAGLIHIVTANPNESNTTYQVDTRFTNDNEQQIKLTATGPISSALFYRFSAHARGYGGNVKNEFTGNWLNDYQTQGVRAKLLWRTSKTLDWLLTADYSKQDTTLGVRVLRVDSNSVLLDPAAIGLTGTPKTVGNITRLSGSEINDRVNLDREPELNAKSMGIRLETNWTIGDYKITNIAAYRQWQQYNERDNDQTQLPFSLSQIAQSDIDWFTNEIRLSSPLFSDYDYVLGLYYYNAQVNEIDGDDRTFSNPAYIVEYNLANNTIQNENAAIFGQINWHFSKQLTGFLGGRYLYDNINATLSRVANTANNPFLSDGKITSVRDVLGISNGNGITHSTKRLGFLYDVTPDVMAYISYATGFKGEAFNTSFKFNEALFLEGPVKHEESETFEFGIKTQWLNSKLQINGTFFHINYNNLQLTVRDLVNNKNVLGSVPEVISQGVELDVIYVISDNFTIESTVTQLNAFYDDFTNAGCYSTQTIAQGCVAGTQDLSGHSLANTADWKAVLSANYNFNMGERPITLSSNWRIQSDVNFDVTGNPDSNQSGYGVLDIGLLVLWKSDFHVKFFVNNVFNKQYVEGVSINGNAGGDLTLQLLPRDFSRFIGINMGIRF